MPKITLGNRKGFTLIETVVTVGIMAIMAAVVIPTVVRQFDVADPTKFQQDMDGIRSAIENFRTRIPLHDPQDLGDLINPIRTSGTLATAPDSTLIGSLYSNADVAAWNGPYLSMTLASGDSLQTAFGAFMQNNFTRFSATDSLLATQSGAVTPYFVAIRITGLDSAHFEILNTRIDGQKEAPGYGAATSSWRAGRLRRTRDGTTYMLLLPTAE